MLRRSPSPLSVSGSQPTASSAVRTALHRMLVLMRVVISLLLGLRLMVRLAMDAPTVGDDLLRRVVARRRARQTSLSVHEVQHVVPVRVTRLQLAVVEARAARWVVADQAQARAVGP